jgi:hypothetical protein
VTAKIAGMKGSAGLKDAIAMEKQLVRYAGLVGRFPPCRDCKRKRHEAMRPGCAGCRTRNASLLDKIVERLGALADGNPDLPIAKTVRDYAGRLKGGRG